MTFKNQKDHWAFLEEIEAPMWVDLTSETKLNSQDIDDKWFQTSHLSHQSSSIQLKTAFSCSGEEGVTIESGLAGASSPALPRSVSRSRGKDFKSKIWKGSSHDVSSKNVVSTKVLKGKSSGAGEGIKSKHSFINSKRTSRLKRSLVSEITENAKEKNVKLVSTGGPKRSSSPVAVKSGETNTKSTVTSESIQLQQQQKSFEVSSRGFGQESKLITSVRISLMKSCITRPASRVKINTDRSHGMESRDSKSSSGKSSVGSSSYPGYEAKRSNVSWIKRKEQTPDSRNVARMTEASKNNAKPIKRKEQTPDSRNAARMTEAAKNKAKPSNMCNKSNVIGKERNCNSRTAGLVTVTKQAREEAIKSKAKMQTHRSKLSVLHQVNEQKPLAGATKAREKANMQTHRSKLSVLHQVNEQKPLAGATKAREKVGVGNKVRGTGKENNIGQIHPGQKCIRKGKAAEGMIAGRKGTTQSTSSKGGNTGTTLLKGRVGNQREGKNSTSSIPKVHFR